MSCMDVRVGPQRSWSPKNWCLQTVVLKKILESPLNSKEIKSVNSKGNQPCIYIGRTDAEAEAPIFWPNNVKNWLEKTVMLGRIEDRRRGDRVLENGMASLAQWKGPWCWERLKAEGEEAVRGWDSWMASPMQWIWTWYELGYEQEMVRDREAWHAAVRGVTKSWTRLCDWTLTTLSYSEDYC